MSNNFPQALSFEITRRHWIFATMVVLLVAAVFRLVALPDIPPGLAQDEVLDANIASFIREGEHAFFFRHGYGHEPLYHYWAVPFQLLFGENVLSIRLPSVYLGLFLVAVTMRWARREFGGLVAIITGLGLAVSWWPIIFSRIGIRPILEPVLLVIAVWFWPLNEKNTKPRSIYKAVLSGLFLGLSFYSYTAARVLFALPILFGLYQLFRYLMTDKNQNEKTVLRSQLGFAGIMLGVALLVYLPMGLTLRANPDLQQRIEQLEGPLAALQAGDPNPVWQTTLATLGVFSFTGDPRWTYTLPDQPLFNWAAAAFFYAGLAIAIWHWRKPVYALLPIWLVVTLLPSALTPDAPSTVRLVGAMPVVYLFPALGISVVGSLWRRRGYSNRVVLQSIGIIILIIVGLGSWRTIREGFVRWPSDIEARLRYQSVLHDIAEHWVTTRQANESMVVTEVFFEPIDQTSLIRTLGIDPKARWVQTGAGVAGGMVWPSGSDGSKLYVPEYAPLSAALQEVAGIVAAPQYRSTAQPSFAVYELPPAPDEIQYPLNVGFGHEIGQAVITLTGFEFELSTASGPAKHAVQLVTQWVVNDTLPDDLAIFIHLVDDSGRLVAQSDNMDVAAMTLQSGDKFIQLHSLSVDQEMKPGLYQVLAGLYQRANNRRLVQLNGLDSQQLLICVMENDQDIDKFICDLPKIP